MDPEYRYERNLYSGFSIYFKPKMCKEYGMQRNMDNIGGISYFFIDESRI